MLGGGYVLFFGILTKCKQNVYERVISIDEILLDWLIGLKYLHAYIFVIDCSKICRGRCS